MAHLTIIPSDNYVYVDGEARRVDCGAFPEAAYINAVQWNDEAGRGWIEFMNDGFAPFLREVAITALPAEYETYRAMWQAVTITTTAVGPSSVGMNVVAD